MARAARKKKMEAERVRMGASISSYYDLLTDEDREQNRAWGAFAESQVPNPPFGS